jgi:hypothetical protein
MLDWSAQKLGDQAGIGVATVRRFETGSSILEASMAALKVALEEAGITFVADGQASQGGGAGVRFSQSLE